MELIFLRIELISDNIITQYTAASRNNSTIRPPVGAAVASAYCASLPYVPPTYGTNVLTMTRAPHIKDLLCCVALRFAFKNRVKHERFKGGYCFVSGTAVVAVCLSLRVCICLVCVVVGWLCWLRALVCFAENSLGLLSGTLLEHDMRWKGLPRFIYTHSFTGCPIQIQFHGSATYLSAFVKWWNNIHRRSPGRGLDFKVARKKQILWPRASTELQMCLL